MDHDGLSKAEKPDSVTVPSDLPMKVTVIGDCGFIHQSFHEWQACPWCEVLLRRALRNGDR